MSLAAQAESQDPFSNRFSRAWHQGNRIIRPWAIDNLLNGTDIDPGSLTQDHIEVLTYSSSINMALSLDYQRGSGRPTSALSVAYLRMLADLGNLAERHSSGHITLQQTNVLLKLSPNQLQGEIIGRATASYHARILTREQVLSATSFADNNWDILMQQDPWTCLEAMSLTMEHFPGTKQGENLQRFQNLAEGDLSPYLSKNYDIETRFAAHVAQSLHKIQAKQGNNHPTPQSKPTIDRYYKEQNRQALVAKERGAKTIPFTDSFFDRPASRLEAYGWLTALWLYTYGSK